jgi:adenosine kinase
MVRHTEECRTLGIPFAADPSQQLARLSPDQVRGLVDGALRLFTNAYEAALVTERTGWSRRQILDRVGCWVTTLGADGVRIERAGEPPVTVPAAPVRAAADPTGVGDAFRAGFLAALFAGLPEPAAARLGCVLAALALEAPGPQEYAPDRTTVAARLAEGYGEQAAAALAPFLEAAL